MTCRYGRCAALAVIVAIGALGCSDDEETIGGGAPPATASGGAGGAGGAGASGGAGAGQGGSGGGGAGSAPVADLKPLPRVRLTENGDPYWFGAIDDDTVVIAGENKLRAYPVGGGAPTDIASCASGSAVQGLDGAVAFRCAPSKTGATGLGSVDLWTPTTGLVHLSDASSPHQVFFDPASKTVVFADEATGTSESSNGVVRRLSLLTGEQTLLGPYKYRLTVVFTGTHFVMSLRDQPTHVSSVVSFTPTSTAPSSSARTRLELVGGRGLPTFRSRETRLHSAC